MKILMNLILSFTFPFLIASTPSASQMANQGQLEYCNERYKFCISYPDNFFTGKNLADNNDGITLYEDVKDIEFKVSGSYNVMNWGLEDIYYFSLEKFVEGQQNIKNIDQNFEEYSYETTFLVDDKLHYYRTYLLDDVYVSLVIIIPANEMETLDKLKEEIEFSINV